MDGISKSADPSCRSHLTPVISEVKIETSHRDVLRGIPHFSMHIIRSTTGDHILDETDLPPATASLMMIGHEIASDRRNEFDRVGQTGKRWYFQGSRKTKAMEAWSEAPLAACKNAGGIYPD